MNSRVFVTIACLIVGLVASDALAAGVDSKARDRPTDIPKLPQCKWENEQVAGQVVCKYLKNQMSTYPTEKISHNFYTRIIIYTS